MLYMTFQSNTVKYEPRHAEKLPQQRHRLAYACTQSDQCLAICSLDSTNDRLPTLIFS